jgi:ATP-binding cassette subfamily F protein uup
MQQRELDGLPQKIDRLESRQQELFALMTAPDFFKRNAEEINALKKELARIEADIETAFERWQALEALQAKQK